MKPNLAKVRFLIGLMSLIGQSELFIILVGGKKGSQKRDIEKAARYLADYRGENK
jgi:hypothetical protein